jgi:diguanylate cyclase (GGDEF)-like protein
MNREVSDSLLLRLLLVEDNLDDEALILRTLGKGGFNVEHTRVETRDELIRELQNRDWDIVLSDYQLPEFNGMVALKTVKEYNLDMPFILISGTIGEELAVEAMRNGAQDYLMKDNLARLVPAIRRELADADERRALRIAHRTLRHQAYHDLLTGLPNRWLLNDRLEQAMAYNRDEGGVAVLFLDLDRFKNINDSLGHLAGDQLLGEVAECLKGELGEGDTLARLGADEFVILLPGIAGREAAADMTRRLLGCLHEPFQLGEQKVYVDARVGIALYPEHGTDADQLIKHAEAAMYHAKQQSHRYFEFASEQIQMATTDRFILENELRGAIRNSQLRLFYQPQFNLRDGSLSGVEALIRWEHPEQGLIAPDNFIPVAEDTGLIVPLGEWVMRQVQVDVEQMRRAGCDCTRLAINLSAYQLYHQDTLSILREMLEQDGLAGEMLEVEITESGMMEDPEQAIVTLKRIREMGIRIAIDDFGTGYSSLAHLKRFPIDILKIDRSFVRDIALDPDDATIVRTIVAMARALNLRVIAEGVETHEQYDFLKQLGCDEVQGFLFARPMDTSALAGYLASLRRELPLPQHHAG